ncbi:MAG TPA: 3-deoxy-manno-octulosonate cytidylyltransferase [Flavobacteriales bacterium]|nr:3-deoxy-manno-octulosonate cytidylyltransferase [Flavobacteriales bacterium]HRO38403.1 3-deoxy-manno-octulosonate cytidylyltransferase [Flavobacteriales bacterium]HRP80410.1 3-deoxy-manno-octulosonate cytidylyltransferase [Flavobacteriales bacterium]HRQ84225.1 3-deoxy-manno-octulosonate cytidylyltransferase [Flavobacteriales bacterium]
MRILGVIPARYSSTRLPGKPLVDIGGKSMVQRVLEQARQSRTLAEVVVATDDARIADHVAAIGGRAVLTSPRHPSGTDRCWEACTKAGGAAFDGVVNIQGDEPFIAPAQIDELAGVLKAPGTAIATLAQVVADDRDLNDPGEVLITVDRNMNALYFSRAAIPFLRHPAAGPRHGQFRFLKHVGLYAYTTEVLEQIVQLPPSPLELAESLEQLRWLENGIAVRVGITSHPSFCIDTEQDLERARQRIAREG